MNRIVTIQTQKTMTETEFELWKEYLSSFEMVTQAQMESLQRSGKLTTLKNGTTSTYTIEQVN